MLNHVLWIFHGGSKFIYLWMSSPLAHLAVVVKSGCWISSGGSRSTSQQMPAHPPSSNSDQWHLPGNPSFLRWPLLWLFWQASMVVPNPSWVVFMDFLGCTVAFLSYLTILWLAFIPCMVARKDSSLYSKLAAMSIPSAIQNPIH